MSTDSGSLQKEFKQAGAMLLGGRVMTPFLRVRETSGQVEVEVEVGGRGIPSSPPHPTGAGIASARGRRDFAAAA